MPRKTVSIIVLALLLTGMLTLAFNIQPVKASGTIYIRADGSIDPPTAPISTTDNVTYTLSDNINDSVVVERSDVVVEGADYTVCGTEAEDSVGIDVKYISNVTIKNTTVKSFYTGLYLSATTYCRIENVTVEDTDRFGILLDDNSNNNIIADCLLRSNNIYAVYFYYVNSNTVINNTASNDHGAVIYLDHSNYNTLCNNTCLNNGNGITLYYAIYNTLAGNIATGGGSGVMLASSNFNSLSDNEISNNSGYNFGVNGEDSDYYNYVDETNTVDGKAICYLIDVDDTVVSNAGVVYLIDCNNITVKDSTIRRNYQGIYLSNTHHSKIQNVTIEGETGSTGPAVAIIGAIWLANSNDNTVANATILDSHWSGIAAMGNRNVITNNVCNVVGDGFHAIGIVGDNCVVTDNMVSGRSTGVILGGIYVQNSYQPTIANNTVSDFRGQGPAIRVYNASYGSITGNSVSNSNTGIRVENTGNNVIFNNTVFDSNIGISVEQASNNRIFHNNFINNTKQMEITGAEPSGNIWDDGYPSGGNYWSDYNGTDFLGGPYQNETGSDGLGDTPYGSLIDNTDHYPLMRPFQFDIKPPTIELPSRIPSGEIQPEESVKISVSTTDIVSGVQNVSLLYTTDDGATWTNLIMAYSTLTDLYEATIPGQEAGTTVRFKIVAYDYAGNNATLDGTQPYCVYQVIPEFSSFFILPLFMIATLLVVIVFKRKNMYMDRE